MSCRRFRSSSQTGGAIRWWQPGCQEQLAAIQGPDSIERVLRAMNARYRARRLPFEAPELAVARAPPDGGGDWLGA